MELMIFLHKKLPEKIKELNFEFIDVSNLSLERPDEIKELAKKLNGVVGCCEESGYMPYEFIRRVNPYDLSKRWKTVLFSKGKPDNDPKRYGFDIVIEEYDKLTKEEILSKL